MEILEGVSIEAARHRYKKLTQRFVELIGWPVVPRPGTRQPASREASLMERRVEFNGQRIFNRVKIQLKTGAESRAYRARESPRQVQLPSAFRFERQRFLQRSRSGVAGHV